MGTTPSTRPISTATFTANTFTFDPLLAGECISQSALIGGATALTRGTVLFGPAIGTPITGTTVLTPVFSTGEVARCILAADIDVTAGNLTGLVYTQGKFLDTAMIFTSQGAALDVAQLWDASIYVLTVEQRSGLLVPMTGLPATGGPLPQTIATTDAEKHQQKAETLREEAKKEDALGHKDKAEVLREEAKKEDALYEEAKREEARREYAARTGLQEPAKDSEHPAYNVAKPAVPNPKR